MRGLARLAAGAVWSRATGDLRRGTELGWRALEGVSEDRIEVLGDLYRKELTRSSNDAGLRLLQAAKDDGLRVVIWTRHVREIVAPLVEALEPDRLIANRLVMDGYRSTGELEEPIIAEPLDGRGLRALADEFGVTPENLRVYASRIHEQVTLAAAPLPCAVTPDALLRRMCAQHHWPVVDA